MSISKNMIYNQWWNRQSDKQGGRTT